MGRHRKPSEMQKGNITVINGKNRKEEENSVVVGKDQLEKPPTWLIDNEAKKEWKRLVKELDKIDIIGNLDKNNLAGYCNAFANYQKATKELKNAPFCVEKETRSGTVIVRNPLIDIQKLYAEEMRKFASLCGLTIDSRLKAAVTKTEKKEDTIKQKFGNI
jgi:P27 family predicted phage terminase small subunit